MSSEKIYFDKTEIVCFVATKKKYVTVNLTYDKFIRISLEKCKELNWFKLVDSEKLVMKIRGREKPIEYTKLQNKKHWQHYVDGLKKFAKDNNIRFDDEVDLETTKVE